MERVGNLISVVDFKRLLFDLKDRRPDICIRYRLLGEMWNLNFMTIFLITDKGVLFNEESKRRLITVTDLSSIMQFEIDKSFQGYQPYYHYEVQPLLDFQTVLT